MNTSYDPSIGYLDITIPILYSAYSSYKGREHMETNEEQTKTQKSDYENNSSFIKRFWSKVGNKDEKGCKEWKGTQSGNYGVINFNGKNIGAHRIAYILEYGDIPKDKPHILHTCNNPLCVNPEHLKVGTHEENMQQRIQNGNYYRPTGEMHKGYKSLKESVKEEKINNREQNLSRMRDSYLNRGMTTEDRFWNYTDKKKDKDCWNWTGGVDSHGYGRLKINGESKLAHRISYVLKHGEIPKDTPFVLHICNNPLCVNPNHLKAGTHEENMKQMTNEGRRKSEDSYLAKLTWEKVKEIRKLYNETKITQKELGEKYNITTENVHSIVNNLRWKDLNYKPTHKDDYTGRSNHNYKLTFKDATEIREKYKVRGVSQLDLGKEYGVSLAEIGCIVRNERWEDDNYTSFHKNEQDHECNSNVKLTWDDIHKIRDRYKNNKNLRQSDLAKEYNLHPSTIKGIINNWTWIDEDYTPVHNGRGSEGERNGSSKITWNIVNAIREEFKKGKAHRKLAKEFGVSKTQIGRIVRNESWSDDNYDEYDRVFTSEVKHQEKAKSGHHISEHSKTEFKKKIFKITKRKENIMNNKNTTNIESLNTEMTNT